MIGCVSYNFAGLESEKAVVQNPIVKQYPKTQKIKNQNDFGRSSARPVPINLTSSIPQLTLPDSLVKVALYPDFRKMPNQKDKEDSPPGTPEMGMTGAPTPEPTSRDPNQVLGNTNQAMLDNSSMEVDPPTPSDPKLQSSPYGSDGTGTLSNADDPSMDRGFSKSTQANQQPVNCQNFQARSRNRQPKATSRMTKPVTGKGQTNPVPRANIPPMEATQTPEPYQTCNSHSNNSPADVSHKKYRFGLSISRIAAIEEGGLTPNEVTSFFSCLSELDPQCMILNHKNDTNKATPVSDMMKCQRLYLEPFVDYSTIRWGKPTENKTRTSILFYVASDLIPPNINMLRQHESFDSIIRAGKCTVQKTCLHQAQAKTLGYFGGKDPQHTNRDELAHRLSQHLEKYSTRFLPVQVIASNVINKQHTTRMCTVLVGAKDLEAAQKILKTHPLPTPEFILHSWKRSFPEDFSNRIKQHVMVVSQSRALKLVDCTPENLACLREELQNSDIIPKIVDIAAAAHFATSGTVYIQYIYAHHQAAEAWLTAVLAKHNITEATIATTGRPGSVMTAATATTYGTASNRTTKDSPPAASVFDTLFPPSEITTTTTPSSAPLPPVSNSMPLKRRSFLDAVKQSGSSAEDDSDTSSISTTHRSNRSTKTERENKELREHIVKQDEELAALKLQLAQLQQMMSQMALQLSGQDPRASPIEPQTLNLESELREPTGNPTTPPGPKRRRSTGTPISNIYHTPNEQSHSPKSNEKHD